MPKAYSIWHGDGNCLYQRRKFTTGNSAVDFVVTKIGTDAFRHHAKASGNMLGTVLTKLASTARSHARRHREIAIINGIRGHAGEDSLLPMEFSRKYVPNCSATFRRTSEKQNGKPPDNGETFRFEAPRLGLEAILVALLQGSERVAFALLLLAASHLAMQLLCGLNSIQIGLGLPILSPICPQRNCRNSVICP